MSLSPPIGQFLQPPPLDSIHETSAHYGGGSFGPVIGVVIFVLFLGVLAGVIGRICSGKSVFGYGNFDSERWLETKCSSCIGGAYGYESPPHRSPVPAPANEQPLAAESAPAPVTQTQTQTEGS